MESNQDPTQVADSERGALIERMVLDIIRRERIAKVGNAVASLQKLDANLTTDEIQDAIKRLEMSGEVNLSEQSVKSSFVRNLVDVEVNFPFWLAVATTAILLVITFALPQEGLWAIAKQISGGIFLFLVPGYATVNALVARNRLSFVERMAIGVGLSLAIVSLIGMMLAYGVAGIKLEPVIASMTAYVVGMALLGAYYDFRRRHKAMTAHTGYMKDRSKN